MLTLPIKKQWFDMIMYGGKNEEYRSMTPYYEQRFKGIGLLDDNGNPTDNEACINLRNGYGRKVPEMTVLVTLKIGTGHPKWGAEEGTWYYVLEIKGRYVKDGDSDADGATPISG